MAKDTKTRYQGVYARHQEGCALEAGQACDCTPSYFGVVYDPAIGRTRKTTHRRLVGEAREARRDLLEAVRKGELPAPSSETITLGEARRRFVKGAKEGVVLNKWRRRYRPRAVEDLEVSLNQIPAEMARRRFDRITRGEVQARVDELTPKVSASRIGSFVNSMRALYRWGEERELADHDPAHHLRLPISDSEARDRVATPAELDRLLKALWRQTPEEIENEITRDPRMPSKTRSLSPSPPTRRRASRRSKSSTGGTFASILPRRSLPPTPTAANRVAHGGSSSWSSRCLRSCARSGSPRAGQPRGRSAHPRQYGRAAASRWASYRSG